MDIEPSLVQLLQWDTTVSLQKDFLVKFLPF